MVTIATLTAPKYHAGVAGGSIPQHYTILQCASYLTRDAMVHFIYATTPTYISTTPTYDWPLQ